MDDIINTRPHISNNSFLENIYPLIGIFLFVYSILITIDCFSDTNISGIIKEKKKTNPTRYYIIGSVITIVYCIIIFFIVKENMKNNNTQNNTNGYIQTGINGEIYNYKFYKNMIN
jgi:Na+-transporting NADH:ubiquinone oxidoreductase subunit NqrE